MKKILDNFSLLIQLTIPLIAFVSFFFIDQFSSISGFDVENYLSTQDRLSVGASILMTLSTIIAVCVFVFDIFLYLPLVSSSWFKKSKEILDSPNFETIWSIPLKEGLFLLAPSLFGLTIFCVSTYFKYIFKPLAYPCILLVSLYWLATLPGLIPSEKYQFKQYYWAIKILIMFMFSLLFIRVSLQKTFNESHLTFEREVYHFTYEDEEYEVDDRNILLNGTDFLITLEFNKDSTIVTQHEFKKSDIKKPKWVKFITDKSR